MENMEKRIELEKRGRQAEEITDLNLDNCRSTQIHGLTDDFKNLKTLSLINVGLTTLKGFPTLPELKKLELSDNRLCSSLNLLSSCSKLSYLNLSGNKIKDLEVLEPLKEMAELKNLDLFNCEITNVEGYREKVFELLPNLVYLDGFDKNDMEAEEDEDENGEGSEDDEEANGENGDDDDEDEDEDSEDEEDEVGLSYLQKSGLEDEDSEGEDFQPNGANDDEDDDSEEDEEDLDDEEDEEEEEGKEKSPASAERGRGIKRKRPVDEENGTKEDKAEK